MDNVATFFNRADGLTTDAVYDGATLIGYFDGDLTNFLIDDAGPAVERYTFVTETFSGWRSSIGQFLTIGSDSYRITGAQPDGSGLIVLNLYAE